MVFLQVTDLLDDNGFKCLSRLQSLKFLPLPPFLIDASSEQTTAIPDFMGFFIKDEPSQKVKMAGVVRIESRHKPQSTKMYLS